MLRFIAGVQRRGNAGDKRPLTCTYRRSVADSHEARDQVSAIIDMSGWRLLAASLLPCVVLSATPALITAIAPAPSAAVVVAHVADQRTINICVYELGRGAPCQRSGTAEVR